MTTSNEDNETNKEALMNYVYAWLCDFYLLDIDFNNIPIDFFEENNQGIMFKTPREVKEILVKKQGMRRRNFKDMVKECFANGESRRFLPLKGEDTDFILELNLIKTNHNQTKRRQDYLDQNLYNGGIE